MRRTETVAAIEIGSTFTKLATYFLTPDGLIPAGRRSIRTSLPGNAADAARHLIVEAEKLLGSNIDIPLLSSSAAGGLRIAVIGLTRSLSTRVAREAGLGAGGLVVFSAAGKMFDSDLEELLASRPNLVVLCGGTNGGHSSTVAQNARQLARLHLDCCYVYAGNRSLRNDVATVLGASAGGYVEAPNVYPSVDSYDFEGLRSALRDAFAKYVVKAPGVAEVENFLGVAAVPTPYAVSVATERLGALVGDTIVLDVGGATTDVHSCINVKVPPLDRAARQEPATKRTVEGDIGVFHSVHSLLETGEASFDEPLNGGSTLASLALRAAAIGLRRHAGHHSDGWTRANGERIEGRDLRRVRLVMGTGGALTHGLQHAMDLATVIADCPLALVPPANTPAFCLDTNYELSSLGLLDAVKPGVADSRILSITRGAHA